MPVDYNQELSLSYLKAAAQAIEDEEARIALYRDFYEGDQDVELTDRQKEYLRAVRGRKDSRYGNLRQLQLSHPANSPVTIEGFDSFGNICKRVIGILSDRLAIPDDGVRPMDDASTRYAEIANEWWVDAETGDNTDPYSLQTDIYEAALRDEVVGVIVGWDDERQRPTFTPNLIYDGATGLLRFHYDDNGKLIFASKRWTTYNPLKSGATGKRRLTVYTPGYIERFEAYTTHGGGWRRLEPEEIDENSPVPNPQPWTDNGTLSGEPLGIPVIPFENPTGSELKDVIGIQELLNHNLSTFDISVDMHAFPVLVFGGFQFPIDSATGYSKIPKLQPGTGVASDDPGANVTRVQPADLKAMFDAGVLSWVQILALVKGWPMFLFDKSQQPPSGVALSIMEQSLVNQINRKQRNFSGAWRMAFGMARQLHRLKTGEELPGQLHLEWKSPEIEDPFAKAELLKAEFEAAQYPIITRWRRMGNTEEDIAQMLEDLKMEDDFGPFADIEGMRQ